MELRVTTAGLVGVLMLATSLAWASDGTPDVGGTYSAVGVYFVASQIPGEPLDAEGYCSGTLIAPDLFLTAAHCTFYDTRRFVEEPAYEHAEAWVSFDPVALDNDFRCYLQDIGYPGADEASCDESGRTVPHPTFHHALSTGITNPRYPRIEQLGNGSLAIHEPLGPQNTDVAVLLLEEPIAGITPLPTAALHRLDDLDPPRPLVVGVGYGLDYHKSIPAAPDQPHGDGPTVFLGDFGVRRIADLGTVRSVTTSRITPTQQSSLEEDSVCYGDSGSPLFLVEDGQVDPTVVGVLTGAALWCMGAHDPYQRVDTEEVIDFLDCVEAAPSLSDACHCGAEEALGLCGD